MKLFEFVVGKILKVRRRRGKELKEILEKWEKTKIKTNFPSLGLLEGHA